MAGRWLLYGANGYTGRLIAAEAAARGMAPIVAGRREAAVRAVAREHGFEWRTFTLEDPIEIARGIGGVEAVLLAAGPFSRTSRLVAEACLAEGVHYVDITGEIPTFEALFAQGREARERGVALLPGAGFDVVPTDCLASALAAALPDADRLLLAIAWRGGGLSRGTAKTMVEGFGRGGAIRKDGRIVAVPHAWRTATIPFEDRPRHATTYPWGDVSTAYHSTGIGNVAVLMAQPRGTARMLRTVEPLRPLLGAAPVRRLAERAIDRFLDGPDAGARERGESRIWGRVIDPEGRRVDGRASTPEAYRFTAISATECVRRLAEEPGEYSGTLTPSVAFGADFLTVLPGCEMRVGELQKS